MQSHGLDTSPVETQVDSFNGFPGPCGFSPVQQNPGLHSSLAPVLESQFVGSVHV